MTYSTKRSSLKTMIALSLAGLAAAAVMAVSAIPQADALVDRRAVSASTNEAGFPAWYQDASGAKRMAPCVEATVMCAMAADPDHPSPIPDPTAPISFPSNYPDAFSYFSGEAMMATGNGGNARLVMNVGGEFVNGPAADGEQMVLSTILVRADGLRPNTSYKITHPYGVINTTSDARGGIRVIRESGCHLEAAGDCNFSRALNSPIFGGFLKWDPAVAPKAAAGYLGNPEVGHRIVGSPKNTNFFRIEGPRAGGFGDTVQTANKFLITGKRFQ